MPGVITVERANGVATVILNNPDKRNSFNAAMLESLAAEASKLAKEDEIRTVILRGAGDLAFSAGADLDGFNTESPETRSYLDYVHGSESGYVSFNFAVRDSDSMELSCYAGG